MAKYLDLEGLNYNNQKIRDYADAVINSPDNLLDNSRNYSIISHCVIGPSVNGNSEASIGAFEETFNGYPARYMKRTTFDYIDTYDTIKVKFDTTKLKAGKTYTLCFQIRPLDTAISFDLRVGALNSDQSEFATSLISSPIQGEVLSVGQRKIISYTFTVNTNGTGAETECIYLVTNTGAFAWEQVELSPFILSESNVGMPWKYSTNDIYNTLPGKGYPIKNTSSTTIRLTPNVYTVHSGTPNSLTLMFGADEYDNTNNMKEYFIEFTTSSSGCSLAVPTTVKWLNGEVPVLEASTSYQLSIVNNLAVIAKFA